MPDNANPQTPDTPRVQCPNCKAPVIWCEANAHRPFCSEHCKNSDFIDWANETHRIAGSSDYDDLLSEQLTVDDTLLKPH